MAPCLLAHVYDGLAKAPSWATLLIGVMLFFVLMNWEYVVTTLMNPKRRRAYVTEKAEKLGSSRKKEAERRKITNTFENALASFSKRRRHVSLDCDGTESSVCQATAISLRLSRGKAKQEEECPDDVAMSGK